ncbi:MAG: hypothetical protein WAL72_12740 [Streptosporangiaceae bacterium]
MNRRSDVLALGSFVVLGLPDGMLGTAWPSMRATFGVPVGALAPGLPDPDRPRPGHRRFLAASATA